MAHRTREVAAFAAFSTFGTAYAQLTQGMLKNYTEFMTEWGQSAMATFAQGQAAMVARAQEATGNVVDVADARGRRSR